MEPYLKAFYNAFIGTVNWTWKSILFEVPWYTNYFWGLIVISLLVWCLELLFPWRKQQAAFRKDFWLDTFYMFFNFFVFAIVISGVYRVLELLFMVGRRCRVVVVLGCWRRRQFHLAVGVVFFPRRRGWRW